MSLHILSDANVRAVLAGLDEPAVHTLCDTLGDALHAYSVGGEKAYQCHRQGVTRPGGPTMLFMPATLADGAAVKVVGVPPPAPVDVSADVGPDTVKNKPIAGVVLVCDADGRATGVLNAAALTALRTSLGSILLFRARAAPAHTRHLVVFGAGRQALWHVHLSLVLHGADVATVTIVNRSAARADDLVAELRSMAKSPAALQHIQFTVLAPTDTASVKAAVQQADVVYCTTPSTAPIFPADWLVSSEKKEKKTRLIAAIGSYTLDMQELDPALLRAVATDPKYPATFHPDRAANGVTGGVILVDSRDACATEAGELVKAAIPDSHILETGEVLQLQKEAQAQADPAKGKDLEEWLATGNVIYKSVGIGIMDLCIGRALLEMGSAQNIGTTVPSF